MLHNTALSCLRPRQEICSLNSAKLGPKLISLSLILLRFRIVISLKSPVTEKSAIIVLGLVIYQPYLISEQKRPSFASCGWPFLTHIELFIKSISHSSKTNKTRTKQKDAPGIGTSEVFGTGITSSAQKKFVPPPAFPSFAQKSPSIGTLDVKISMLKYYI